MLRQPLIMETAFNWLILWGMKIVQYTFFLTMKLVPSASILLEMMIVQRTFFFLYEDCSVLILLEIKIVQCALFLFFI